MSKESDGKSRLSLGTGEVGSSEFITDSSLGQVRGECRLKTCTMKSGFEQYP